MKTRLLLGALGVLVMGYAVYGALTDPGSRPVGQLTFLAEVLVAHDLVLLPLGIAIGALAARLLPPAVRRTVQGGLWASAVIGLIALPFIVGNGHPPDNPSALPRDYPLGLLAALAVIWSTVAVLLIVRRRRARGAGRAAAPGAERSPAR